MNIIANFLSIVDFSHRTNAPLRWLPLSATQGRYIRGRKFFNTFLGPFSNKEINLIYTHWNPQFLWILIQIKVKEGR